MTNKSPADPISVARARTRHHLQSILASTAAGVALSAVGCQEAIGDPSPPPLTCSDYAKYGGSLYDAVKATGVWDWNGTVRVARVTLQTTNAFYYDDLHFAFATKQEAAPTITNGKLQYYVADPRCVSSVQGTCGRVILTVAPEPGQDAIVRLTGYCDAVPFSESLRIRAPTFQNNTHPQITALGGAGGQGGASDLGGAGGETSLGWRGPDPDPMVLEWISGTASSP